MIEGKIEVVIKVKGRQGRIRKQLWMALKTDRIL
jgi:hypothetical protein